jgi:DNA adenine methylase
MAIKNPLRYPGAKSNLYDYISQLLITEDKIGCTFYEPFAGSSALSLKLLETNIIKEAVINEKDPLIYYFWISVFYHTEELIAKIKDADITIENWGVQSNYRNENYLVGKSPVDIGFAGLFLNRTNYSGILKATPIGGLNQTSKYPIDCRFNKEVIISSIESISSYRNRIRVYNMDAIEFMSAYLKYKRSNKLFVYIDPPYYKEGPGLYRCFYTPQQHVALAKFIRSKTFPWLISYDDVPEIRKLYQKQAPINIYLDYSVNTCRKGEELLISNLEIPPLTNTESELQPLIG